MSSLRRGLAHGGGSASDTRGVREAKRRAIAAAYQDGTMTVEQIAEQYGTSPAMIVYHSKKGGAAPRKRGRRRLTEPTALQQEILRKSNATPIRELVNQFRFSRQYIHQLRKRWPAWVIPVNGHVGSNTSAEN